MKTSDFWYDLPHELIAQTPAEPRDSSRLLVYNRGDGSVTHRHFRDVTDYLRPGDALLLNDTKVIPARLYGVSGEGVAAEVLLLKRKDATDWEALTRPGKKLKVGCRIVFSDRLSAEVISKRDDGVNDIRFTADGVFEEILDELGTMPLPPYITEKLADQTRYQTVYAKTEGSAAAPTAGLHFTPELLQRIEAMGVSLNYALLHVGLGTFRPVRSDSIEQHEMHSEYFCMPGDVAAKLNETKQNGGRVICVGTTSVRILESSTGDDGVVRGASGNTDIFIYPGYKWKAVDALITNFHLPESTLIMLVAALCGREQILDVYKTAVDEKYRFFSFGDAMLLI